MRSTVIICSIIGWQKKHPHHSLSGGGLDLTLIQGQDQDQGQGQDHLLLQRAALPPFLVLALTLVLTLELVQDSASQPYLSWITMFWITMFGSPN